jgi:putative Ca2+/H+ antiporter (TMEM165/GDT1 family)
LDDVEDIVVAFTEVVALLVVVVVENWFCPFGAETTLKTLLEAAEKALFFIVVFKASLKEEEEEEDKEVDEIAKWFMLFVCGERLVFESEIISFSKKKEEIFTLDLKRRARTCQASVFLRQSEQIFRRALEC